MNGRIDYNDKDSDITDSGILLSQADTGRRVYQYYRLSLMQPSVHVGAKIPTEYPIPSATAAFKYNFTVTPNATGKFLFVYDPFVKKPNLYITSTLDGSTALGTDSTTPVFGIDEAATFIDNFRIVSCGVTVRYIGQLQTLSGFLCGSIQSALGDTNAMFTKFDDIENTTEKKVVSPLEGLRLVYVPRDSAMTDFSKLDSTTKYFAVTDANIRKFLFVIYGDGLPNSACLRFDVHLNIEFVSKLTCREYINHSRSVPSSLDATSLNNITLVDALG